MESALPTGRKTKNILPVLRYPGGKQRLLNALAPHLPAKNDIARYVEPFVGGGAVFLHMRPRRAILSDLNAELVELYRALKSDPAGVWQAYASYKGTKREYERVRARQPETLTKVERAARLLYLNRTCFKGNWRHNSSGHFNVGYGGQSRRWVIDADYLAAVGRALSRARLIVSDFEAVIDECGDGDFMFVDPPYRPGQRDLAHAHYVAQRFTFEDHRRLAAALARSTGRGARWVLTTSSHPDLIKLYPRHTARELSARGEAMIWPGVKR